MRAPTTTIDPPAEQTGAPEPADTSWWRSRPVAALSLRIAIFLAPILVSILLSWVIARRWPRPPGLAPSIGWWVVLIGAGSLAMLGVDRVSRRLLPLSTLLRMSLVFPDEKPSRFGVALRNGTTRQLERRLADVHENGLVGNERQAAEQLLGLVAALRLHDRFTRGHGERVRAYSALIGEELGLDEVELSKLQWAGLIHDVGKLAVPDEVLNKPGKLTDAEFELIKTHPAEGMKLVGPLAPWLGEWVLAVGEHHERWDGTGYPNRLAGTEISRAGRIVAVADVFDVITAARSYKTPQAPHAAREELARHAGSQFDPEMVRAFLNVSIGRLRTVMWPLSWLANVPYLGSTVTAPATSWLAPALVAVGGAVTGGSLGDEPRPPAPPVVVDVGDGSVIAPADGPDDGGELPVRGAAANPVLVAGTTTTTTDPSATTTTLTTTTLAGSTGSTGSTTVPVRTPITGDVVVVGPPPGIPQSNPSTATTTTLPITSGTLPRATLPPTTVVSPTIPTTVPSIPTVPTIPTPTLPPPTLPATTLPPLPTTLPPLPTTTLPATTLPPLPTTLPPLPTTTLPATTLPPLPTTLPPLPTTTLPPLTP